MGDSQVTGFRPGDRVRITSRDHPWHGSTGTISAPFESKSAPDLKWTVSLDGCCDAAVSESDIRRAR
jgi:hypothetical protein